MALVLLASATGSPGASTTALGLALHWPRHVVLVDADPDPAQTVQAGWLRGVDIGGRGLSHVAAAHRERRSVAEEAWLQTVALTEGDEPSRRFLPGFTHPAAARHFEPVWGELAPALASLSLAETDVLVDVGRLARGIPTMLVESADCLLVCVRSNLRSLAGLRLHLPPAVERAAQASGRCQVGLVVVGEGRPYSSREIAEQFATPVWARIAWDPRHAEVFSDGAVPPRALGRGGLVSSFRAAAGEIDGRIASRREQLGRPGAA